jgi:hypothetical protein
MRRDELKAKIKEYLESNEGNIDLNQDGMADTEVVSEKIMNIVCEYYKERRFMEALDKKFATYR